MFDLENFDDSMLKYSFIWPDTDARGPNQIYLPLGACMMQFNRFVS